MVYAQTVFVVDDNPEMRTCLTDFLRVAGLNAHSFGCARSFLDGFDPSHAGCVLLDLNMPGMSGLEVQQTLKNMAESVPVIIVSGHSVVSDVVNSMKFRPFDFIEKPYEPSVLLARVRDALEHNARSRTTVDEIQEFKRRFSRLSRREKQILWWVVSGRQSKTIADELSLSPSTVDNHRANLMKKLKAENSADLVRIAVLVDPARAIISGDKSSPEGC